MATLGQISDAEDIIEELTGGAKIVRSQFCRVPLDLVIDFGKIEAQPEVKEDVSVPAILSHEALPKMTFQVANIGNTYVGVSSYDQADDQSAVASKKRVSNEMQSGTILIFFIYSYCILKFIHLLNLGLFTILWYSLFCSSDFPLEPMLKNQLLIGMLCCMELNVSQERNRKKLKYMRLRCLR